MKPTYILGLDVAKHKIRAALRGPAEEERCLWEKDLPASAASLRELRARLQNYGPGSKSKCPRRSNSWSSWKRPGSCI